MKKRKFFFILSMIVFILFFITSYDRNPKTVSYNREDIKYYEAIKEIDSIILREIKKHDIPGLSIALVDENGIIWTKGYGYQDVNKKTHTTQHTLYRIGSDTKPFTATAILILVDRGLINLDTPITKYIPDFSIKSRFAGDNIITVRHLLSHHSGIRRDIYKDYEGYQVPQLDSVVDELKQDYLTFPPEDRYKYSNIGYSLLGKIIENVSGKSYEEFIEEEIFAPLGMNDSYPCLCDKNISKISKGYKVEGKLFKKYNEVLLLEGRDKPAGSIVSNVTDLSKFIQCIFNEGKNHEGKQLLSKKLLNEMFVVQYPNNELDDDPYGLGWKVNITTIPYTDLNISHGGTQTGFQSLLAALPHEKLGVVILYNANQVLSRHFIANKALELLNYAKKGIDIPKGNNELLEKDNIVKIEPESYKEFEGRYVVNFDIPFTVDISPKDTELNIEMDSNNLTLVPVDNNRFKVKKKILFFKIGIGRFVGYDDVMFDFYKTNNGNIYPRLIFIYEDLEMKMLLEKVQPYKLPEYIYDITGTYELTEDSSKKISNNSFENFLIMEEDNWILAKSQFDGSDFKVLLKPIDLNHMLIAGSEETITVEKGKLYYSGLTFKRKQAE